MLDKIDHKPVTTILIGVAFLIIVIAGAVVTIVNPDTLPFDDYLQAVAFAAGALGLLGIGRGINLNGEKRAGADALALAAEGGLMYEDPDLPPEAVPEDEGGTTLG